MKYSRASARPYAKAIFELALQQEQLVQWSQILQALAVMGNDEAIKSLYRNPRIMPQQWVDLFYNILVSVKLANPQVRNLLELLAYYRRLYELPAIAELYEEFRAQLEKTLHVSVTSVHAIKKSLAEKLQKVLEIRLQRSVSMEFVIDKKIIGGAIIRAGDIVIDGSVRSKLEKLRQAVVS